MKKRFQHKDELKNNDSSSNGIFNMRGFTLLEIVLAIGMVSIISGSIFSTFHAFTKSHRLQDTTTEIQQKSRAGIIFLLQDIRMAGLDPYQIGHGIQSAETTTIIFTSDINMDGDAADDGEYFHYYLKDNNELILEERIGGNLITSILVDSVSEFEFDYLDEFNLSLIDNATSTVPPYDLRKIRAVNIILETDKVFVAAGKKDRISRSATTIVLCRN